MGADSFNIILKDKKRYTNKGYSYHSNITQVVKEIVTKLEIDSILVEGLDSKDYLAKSSELCSPISLLMNDIAFLLKDKLEKLKQDLK